MSPWPALALALLASSVLAQNDVDFWNVERPQDMANIKSLDVMCGKTHMEVQISFDRPYNGIIFSKGAVDQYNCIYVKPQTGATAYSFNIMYNQVTSTFSTAASGLVRLTSAGCRPDYLMSHCTAAKEIPENQPYCAV